MLAAVSYQYCTIHGFVRTDIERQQARGSSAFEEKEESLDPRPRVNEEELFFLNEELPPAMKATIEAAASVLRFMLPSSCLALISEIAARSNTFEAATFEREARRRSSARCFLSS